MARPTPHLKLWALAVGAGLLGSASCGDDFDPPSELKSLRVVALAADRPYAAPGDEVTLSLTYVDEAEGDPRPIQVTWLGSCVNPPGGLYYACYPQLDLASVRQEVLMPERSGELGATTYAFTVPEDVVDTAPEPSGGSARVGTAFVLFALCAGTLQPAAREEGAGIESIPFSCVDDAGNALGADDFVFGYTQVFSFADGRENTNPAIEGIVLGEEVVEDTRVVAVCPQPEEEGCGPPEVPACALDIRAIVGNVAEPDGSAMDEEGRPLKEVVWVDFYSDRGEFENDRVLVSDATTGFIADHGTVWTPPASPGPVQIWAVAHDNRGGMSVTTASVRVE